MRPPVLGEGVALLGPGQFGQAMQVAKGGTHEQYVI